MHFDFDKVIDRKGTASVKHDLVEKNGYPEDVLPMWVADMDFEAPPCVLEAMEKRLRHGIFGYSFPEDGYQEAVCGWFRRRFDWPVEPEWIVQTPGVVFAVSAAVRVMTQPGESVLVQTPVYYPFFDCVERNGRKLVTSELKYENGRYRVDYDAMERKIVEEQVKLLILCSPHNPICRVWSLEELQTVGNICRKHGVRVVADEIHCDFVQPGYEHIPFVKACPELAEDTVVCTAPSKTFNLAGLQVSNLLIPGEKLREAYREELSRIHCTSVNCLGMVACRAAYEGGEEWLEACKAYMNENLRYVRDYLKAHLPQIRLVEPEGTYFAWLDCSGLGLNKDQLDELIVHKAKLWLDTGSIFGESAAQFQRVVLACPRSVVMQAMENLRTAVETMK